jgi:hypothetical protein
MYWGDHVRRMSIRPELSLQLWSVVSTDGALTPSTMAPAACCCLLLLIVVGAVI